MLERIPKGDGRDWSCHDCWRCNADPGEKSVQRLTSGSQGVQSSHLAIDTCEYRLLNEVMQIICLPALVK